MEEVWKNCSLSWETRNMHFFQKEEENVPFLPVVRSSFFSIREKETATFQWKTRWLSFLALSVSRNKKKPCHFFVRKERKSCFFFFRKWLIHPRKEKGRFSYQILSDFRYENLDFGSPNIIYQFPSWWDAQPSVWGRVALFASKLDLSTWRCPSVLFRSKLTPSPSNKVWWCRLCIVYVRKLSP